LKAAVIGICGGIARFHAMACKKLGIELAYVVDINPAVSEIAKEYGCKSLTDYRELLNKDIDMVIVALPPYLHPKVCSDFLKRGINVFCQKPIAANSKDAQQLVNIVRKSNAKFMVGYLWRFHPAIIKLREVMQNGDLGKIYIVNVKDSHAVYGRKDYPDVKWRKERKHGGGVTLILAIHELDLVPWMLSKKPLQVFATGGNLFYGPGSETEDSMRALMKLEGRASFYLDTNWWSHNESILEFEFIGSEGRAIIENPRTRPLMKDSSGDSLKLFVEGGKEEVIKFPPTDCFAEEIKCFSECLKDNTEPPITVEDGLQSIQLAETILQSMEKNELISL
jgi:UDP-N-acetylglucosamine 3-dehydrogenase